MEGLHGWERHELHKNCALLGRAVRSIQHVQEGK